MRTTTPSAIRCSRRADSTAVSLVPRAEAHQRVGLFGAIYLVTYAAFGIPAIVAGALIASVGVGAASAVYGAVAVLVATVGVVLLLTRGTTKS